MEIKNLQKSQAIYNQVVDLDKDINAIEKRAMKLADKSQIVNLNLSFETDTKNPVLDSDGSLHEDSPLSGLYSLSYLMGGAVKKSSEPKDELIFNLSETETLFILGSLIQIKKEQRKLLINQLLQLGFVL